MRFLNPDSVAENPGGIRLSSKKYKQILKLLGDSAVKFPHTLSLKKRIDEYLCMGDTQPAVVVSVKPFTVAAYSDEMDAVVMLRFPDEFAEKYSLTVGSRLVTSNVYAYGNAFNAARDIFVGKNYLNRYSDFIPMVSLFLSDDEKFIRSRTELFDEELWKTAEHKAEKYLLNHPKLYRNGFYYLER